MFGLLNLILASSLLRSASLANLHRLKHHHSTKTTTHRPTHRPMMFAPPKLSLGQHDDTQETATTTHRPSHSTSTHVPMMFAPPKLSLGQHDGTQETAGQNRQIPYILNNSQNNIYTSGQKTSHNQEQTYPMISGQNSVIYSLEQNKSNLPGGRVNYVSGQVKTMVPGQVSYIRKQVSPVASESYNVQISQSKPLVYSVVNSQWEMMNRQPDNLQPEFMDLQPEFMDLQPEFMDLQPEFMDLQPEFMNLQPGYMNLLNRQPDNTTMFNGPFLKSFTHKVPPLSGAALIQKAELFKSIHKLPPIVVHNGEMLSYDHLHGKNI